MISLKEGSQYDMAVDVISIGCKKLKYTKAGIKTMCLTRRVMLISHKKKHDRSNCPSLFLNGVAIFFQACSVFLQNIMLSFIELLFCLFLGIILMFRVDVCVKLKKAYTCTSIGG